jgi:thiosulfate/3-mercaptopyruvate sulfurtransferase
MLSLQSSVALMLPLLLTTARPAPERHFVSVAELRAASLDTITLLDARDASDFNRGHLPGAARVSWLDYRDGWGRTGRLPDDLERLGERLGALGVLNARTVIVYGDAHEGWGEEGRIAWMLRYLGHDDVRVLNGGYRAWTEADGAVSRRAANPAPGTFTVRVTAEYRASADDVARARADGAVVLDTRSLDEWNGSMRYLPARTGRIPQATHLEWTELLTDGGLLDRSPAMQDRLRALGLTPDTPIIAYCVGGVRSAFVTMALRELGFTDVRNYDGSWYEWAADRSRPVEKPPAQLSQRSATRPD